LSTLVFYIGARLYLLPRLHELDPKAVLLPILLLHAMRHLGLSSWPRAPPILGSRRNSLTPRLLAI